MHAVNRTQYSCDDMICIVKLCIVLTCVASTVSPQLQLRAAILKVWEPLGLKLDTVRAERDKLKLAMHEKKERELEEEYVLQRLRRTAALQVCVCEIACAKRTGAAASVECRWREPTRTILVQ